MKQLTRIVSVTVCMVIFYSTFAQAKCPEYDFEGTYSNGRGDKFKIEQPDCRLALVTDLQQDLKFEMRLDGTSNRIEDSSIAIGRDILARFPVTYSANQASWRNGSAVLTFQTQLKLGQKDHAAGFQDLPMKMNLVIHRYEWQGRTHGLFIQLEDLRAGSSYDSSPVQRALARGINLGIKIVNQILGRGNNYYSEFLSKVG
jgi:hypothetical protein